ncbi:MAG: signal peptidase I [Cryomorphaceae bacterium]|jgi:signal peptidase I
MFKPKWKKQALLLHKGAMKFLNYKRDLMEPDRVIEIESRRADLKSAIKAGKKEEALEAGKLLEKTCEHALPKYRSPNAFQENIEVFFVAIVVALGIRAYFLQPFRIPTNSMYPALNGITGGALVKKDWPSFPVRMVQQATHGRNYFSLTASSDARIVDITDYQSLHFFPRVRVQFSSGQIETFSGSATSLEQAGLTKLYDELIKKQDPGSWARLKHKSIDDRADAYFRGSRDFGQPIFKKYNIEAGTKVLAGYTESGDLILVDKVSYHFKSPKQDEVFVFDTRGIEYIEESNRVNKTPPSHYIKRLIATPGQNISIQPVEHNDPDYPDGGILIRDGQNADDPGIMRVQSRQGGFNGYMLMGITNKQLDYKPSTGQSEYWAMGDNSYKSSDSRVWGSVKEFNVVGPAFLSLWPFGSGHWGKIK